MTGTATPPEATDAAALLAGVDAWLNTLAKRNAAQAKLLPSELHHLLRVDLVLHAHQFDPARGKPTTWAAWRLRAVLSQLGHQRRNDAYRGRRQPWGDLADELATGREPDPASVAERAELWRAISRRLDRLPARMRRVVTMRFGLTADGREWSTAEIADALGVSANRVNHTLARALARLRRSRKLRAVTAA